MNPIENMISGFQNVVNHVPEFAQPLIVAVAGAVPFIEGEVSAMIGILGGMTPIVAAVAAAIGNFLSVLLVVMFGARFREAIKARKARKAPIGMTEQSGSATDPTMSGQQPALAHDVNVGSAHQTVSQQDTVVKQEGIANQGSSLEVESNGKQRFRRFLTRFGVPGATILGPLALPTQFTAAILVTTGVSKNWILLWQAVAIVLWTSFTTVSAMVALQLFYS